MKKITKTIILIIAFASFLQSSIAQIRVSADFNSVYSGRSINILASSQIKNRHEFGGGLRININKSHHNDDQYKAFMKRMHATKPLHYFGVEGFYQIHFLKKLQHIDLFAFYDIQVCYSTTGNRELPFALNLETGLWEWVGEHVVYFGPFTWIEQNIGIGISVDIWKNIYLIQRLGAGTNFILGKDKPFGENKDYYMPKKPFVNEFGFLLSVGIGYRFETKKK